MSRNRFARLFKLETAFLAATFVLSSFVFTGCNSGATNTTQTTEETIETTIATPTPTPSPTPDPRVEALEIANYVGLGMADLREKYDLFLRYSEVARNNPGLSGYLNYVYAIFPVVADHLESENEEYFFSRLATLKIYEDHNQGADGQYGVERNTIELEPGLQSSVTPNTFASILFHELIHFVDMNVCGYEFAEGLVVMDDGSVRKLSDLNVAEHYSITEYLSSYFVEGGAELYTCDYFSHAPNSYSGRVKFLVGMQYIFGVEKVDEMFFAVDTDYLFYQLLLDNGFTSEEAIKAFHTMRFGEAGRVKAEKALDPREVLIRLYINNVGPDYEKDKAFCIILGSMQNNELDKLPSAYKKFYSKLKGVPEEDSSVMWSYPFNIAKISEGTKIGIVGQPGPLYYEGRLVLGVTISPMDGTIAYTGVIAYYDFENGQIERLEYIENWAPKEFDESLIPTKEEEKDSNEIRRVN